MKATTRSPNRSSGRPTTTACLIPGCSSRARSTSDDEMFSPPRMISSLMRPVMASHPCIVQHAEVTAAEPAPVHGGRCLCGIGVAGEQLGPPDPDLALLPRRAAHAP